MKETNRDSNKIIVMVFVHVCYHQEKAGDDAESTGDLLNQSGRCKDHRMDLPRVLEDDRCGAE